MANITLKLEVKDKHGNFLNNVEVTHNDVDYYTDDNGVVEFSVPRDEDCTVTLKKDGFKDLVKTISKRDLVHTVEIKMENYIPTKIKVIIKDELGRLPDCEFLYNNENFYSTNENGECIITEGITIGKGTFSVHKNGYDVARAEIDVKAEKTNHVTLNLHIQDNSYGYFIPTVYDECHGNVPLAGVEIALINNETGQIVDRAVTDENGTIRELEVHNKVNDLRIWKKGYVFIYAKNFVIRPYGAGMQDATRRDIHLKQYALVDIHVENTDDESINQAVIEYDNTIFRTNSNGNLTLGVLAGEDAVLNVSKDEFESREVIISADRLVCGEHTSENIRLTWDRYILVECAVETEQYDRLTPVLTAVVTHKGVDYPVDENGIAYLTVSYEEDCNLLIKAEGYETDTLIISKDEFKPFYPIYPYNTMVQLRKREVTDIYAFVHNSDKTGIPQAKIQYMNGEEVTDEFITNETGHAHFVVWNTEPCVLKVSAEGYDTEDIVIDADDLVWKSDYTLDVELTPAESSENIILKTKVVDEADTPLKDVAVEKDGVSYYTNSNGIASIVVNRENNVTLNISKLCYVSQSVTVDKAEFEGKTVYEHTVVLERKKL